MVLDLSCSQRGEMAAYLAPRSRPRTTAVGLSSFFYLELSYSEVDSHLLKESGVFEHPMQEPWILESVALPNCFSEHPELLLSSLR